MEYLFSGNRRYCHRTGHGGHHCLSECTEKNLLNSILDTVTMFPFIIPGSVLGISFLFAFNSPPIVLSGTALIMIISFAIRRMPYTVRSSVAALGQISKNVEEAAISLGASDLTTFRRITLL